MSVRFIFAIVLYFKLLITIIALFWNAESKWNNTAYKNNFYIGVKFGFNREELCKKMKTNKNIKVNRLTSLVTLLPNSHPAPRGLIAHRSTSSGSDQTRCKSLLRLLVSTVLSANNFENGCSRQTKLCVHAKKLNANSI